MNAASTDDRRILQARALVLARAPAAAADAGVTLEVVEFSVAGERYGVENRFVLEVAPLKDLTPLPCTPPFVRGIVNLRGRILPVLDLKKFFDLPEEGVVDLHSIILVRGDGVEFGLLADLVIGVRAVAAESLQTSLATLTGIRGSYLKGVTPDRLVVLDLAVIFADPRIVVHEEVES
jgi:purine-binding chemotaxis protein CheW